MTTIREYFENMPAAFRKDAAKGLTAVYQFDIAGEGGGKWYAAIAGGEIAVAEGEHAKPHLVITMNAKDFLDMASGKLGGMMAYATGKLKAKGDMTLAMKMSTLFKH